ncbi:MAG: decaprenyl-phosphate phosphoribosyltransferase [Luteitalea sp.]|nr:decaprenyl-phosphate phosphoribosyltransferase [Luteitalea sp.]
MSSSSGVDERSGLVSALVYSLRPGQWTKNLIVFAPLLFGRELFNPTAVARSTAALAIFCALSGAVYLANDVLDREADRRHPIKARRPVASGQLPVPVAILAAFLLGCLAIAGALALGRAFALVAGTYLGLLLLYSGPLKQIVILDVLVIAIGFVLRAAAGGVAVNVPISKWLLVCTILLALFLALSKRRHELVLLADDAANHRAILKEYSPYLLDQMIAVVAASTLIGYTFYTMSPETVAKFGTESLVFTLPFPLYGLFRYLYLVHRKDKGGSPSEVLLTDRPLLLCVALWALTVSLIIYRPLGYWIG